MLIQDVLLFLDTASREISREAEKEAWTSLADIVQGLTK